MTESSSGNFNQTGDFQEFSGEIIANWQERIDELSADVDPGNYEMTNDTKRNLHGAWFRATRHRMLLYESLDISRTIRSGHLGVSRRSHLRVTTSHTCAFLLSRY